MARKKGVGRVKKYFGEKRVIRSVYLPLSLSEEVERFAKSMGISFNEAVVRLLISANTDTAKALIEYYKDLRERVDSIATEMRARIEELDPVKVFERVEEIELPPEIQKDRDFVDNFKRAVELVRSGRQTPEVASDWLSGVIARISTRYGYNVRNRRLLRVWLAKKLSSYVG